MPLGIGRYSQHNKLTLQPLDAEEEVTLGVEYNVLFLGRRSVNTPTAHASLRTAEVVDQIYNEKYAPIGSTIHLKKLRLKLSDQCISIAQPPTKNHAAQLLVSYGLPNVTYVSTDLKHERAFVIVTKSMGLYEANVFLCDNKKQAKELYKKCADAFQVRIGNNESMRIRASSIGMEVVHLRKPDAIERDKALKMNGTHAGSTDHGTPADENFPPYKLNGNSAYSSAEISSDLSESSTTTQPAHSTISTGELLVFDESPIKKETSRSMDGMENTGTLHATKENLQASPRSLSLTNVSQNSFSEFGDFQSSPAVSSASEKQGGVSNKNQCFILSPPMQKLSLQATSSNPGPLGINTTPSQGPTADQGSPVSPSLQDQDFGSFQAVLSHGKVQTEEDEDEFTFLATKRVVELPGHLQPKGPEASMLIDSHLSNDIMQDQVQIKPMATALANLSRKNHERHLSEGENLLQF